MTSHLSTWRSIRWSETHRIVAIPLLLRSAELPLFGMAVCSGMTFRHFSFAESANLMNVGESVRIASNSLKMWVGLRKYRFGRAVAVPSHAKDVTRDGRQFDAGDDEQTGETRA